MHSIFKHRTYCSQYLFCIHMRMQRNLADKTLHSQLNTPQPLWKNNSVFSAGLQSAGRHTMSFVQVFFAFPLPSPLHFFLRKLDGKKPLDVLFLSLVALVLPLLLSPLLGCIALESLTDSFGNSIAYGFSNTSC